MFCERGGEGRGGEERKGKERKGWDLVMMALCYCFFGGKGVRGGRESPLRLGLRHR